MESLYDNDIIRPRFTKMMHNMAEDTKPESFEKMMEQTPQTNEEKNIESAQWTWESKIWIGLICVIIIILAGLVFWFVWRPNSTKSGTNNTPPNINPNNKPSQKPDSKTEKLKQHNLLKNKFKKSKKTRSQNPHPAPQPKPKKPVMLGPVPGISPDNPEVFSRKKKKTQAELLEEEYEKIDNMNNSKNNGNIKNGDTNEDNENFDDIVNELDMSVSDI